MRRKISLHDILYVARIYVFNLLHWLPSQEACEAEAAVARDLNLVCYTLVDASSGAFNSALPSPFELITHTMYYQDQFTLDILGVDLYSHSATPNQLIKASCRIHVILPLYIHC